MGIHTYFTVIGVVAFILFVVVPICYCDKRNLAHNIFYGVRRKVFNVPRPQATLPESLVDKSAIKYMAVGEQAFTVPWAAYADKDKKVWLNVSMSRYNAPSGTVQMKIRRAVDGWEILGGMNRLEPGGYYGVVADREFEPVVSIRRY